MNKELTNAIFHWQQLMPFLTQPTNAASYNKKVNYLDELLDIVGSDETHELMPLIDLLSDAISQYEVEHTKLPRISTPIDTLKFFMQEYQLKQKDLVFLGSQGVVSEILSGKRKLNMRQVKALAKHFKLSPATFID